MYVYILENQTKKHYIGMTKDLEKRLSSHNRGSNRSTKNGRPWHLVYFEECATKVAALKREKQIKAYKGGQAFKNLLILDNFD